MRVTFAGMLAALVLSSAPLEAREPKPFVAGSHTEIRATYAGRAFILAFWSLDCPHCHEELALFGQLRERDPALPVVLVATDSPEQGEAIATVLARYGLADVESWVFADAFSERLRFEVDPRWRGELPRTYLFGPHGVRAVSGRITEEEIEVWRRSWHTIP